ncbi:Retroelement pol Polyprotein [Phytophthora megakarya]|uniref:Retroelement pol Polyprotein n=1 Tax=Phytophthora megakarya TaxID=4795 RepID=A0A225WN63_9STRA|nr:Retroelement pol Polyprotein [Phytophthora megakarya]
MARAMMLGAHLPMRYWADAVVAAAYVRNRCPTKVLDGKTPMEALLGKAPDISNLRVFGCKVQVLVPQQHRKKLDSKTRNGIFVGYATGGAYLVHIPENGAGETVTARTIVFYENQFLPVTNEDEITISTQLETSAIELVHRAEQHLRLERIEEENGDVVMVRLILKMDRQRLHRCQHGQIQWEGKNASTPAWRSANRESGSPSPSVKQNPKTHGVFYSELASSYIDNWALGVEPISLEEVQRAEDRIQWEDAMHDEFRSLVENETFVEVPLLPGRSAIKSKWVFKKKMNADGSLDKYKTRVVAKGFSQRYGEDYTETFSPVVTHSTVRLVLVIAVQRRMRRVQLDIKTAFLNSELEEEIYLELVEGFESPDGHAWRLLRALYGLKQASKAWYDNFTAFLLGLGFRQGAADTCLFVKGSDETLMIVLSYVDDILAFAMTEADIDEFKTAVEEVYTVNYYADVSYFLGLERQWSERGDEVRLGQQKYATTILERFGMQRARTVRTPMEDHYRDHLFKVQDLTEFRPRPAIGTLLYLSVISRPDITTAVRLLAQELERPTDSVKNGVDRVFRYINGTRDFGLILEMVSATASSYIVMLRSPSREIPTEYIAMSTGVQECIGLNMILKDLGLEVEEILVMEDNQGAQHLAESKAVMQRSRHINTKHHWLREKVALHEVRIQYCPGRRPLHEANGDSQV